MLAEETIILENAQIRGKSELFGFASLMMKFYLAHDVHAFTLTFLIYSNSGAFCTTILLPGPNAVVPTSG